MNIKNAVIQSALALCLLSADRMSKLFALQQLRHHDIQLFPGLNLTLEWNSGISLGMLKNMQPFYTTMLTGVIVLIVLAFFIYTVQQYKKGKIIIGEALVLIGAISNITDRFLYGAVIDFIHIVWPVSLPVFNIADMLIVIGVGVVMFNQRQA